MLQMVCVIVSALTLLKSITLKQLPKYTHSQLCTVTLLAYVEFKLDCSLSTDGNQQLNVLICTQGRAHLADFGLSMLLTEPSTLSHSLTESAQWAAPELIEPPTDNSINPWDLLSFQSDMYSFGSVMFHVSLIFSSFTTATNT